MRRAKKNVTIELPLSVTLTDDGKYFFNQRRSDAHDKKKNFVGDEIQISAYSAKTLQRMVYAGYVSRIELSRSDFLSKRAEIMDVSKLIAYAILYKKFGMILGRELSDTPVIVGWNRKHPQQPLNEFTMVGDSEKFLGHEELSKIIDEIVQRAVGDLIAEDETLSTEEREIARLKGEHFLESLNPLLWGLLIKQADVKSRTGVLREIEAVLKNYLRRTVIADYLSLLIMELGAYAETSLLKRALAADPSGELDFSAVMKDAELRRSVLQRVEESQGSATLAWRIQGRRFTLGNDKATHIVLYNRMVDSREVRREIENSNKHVDNGKGLAEFYGEKLSEEEDLSGRIGLSYLSYLEDACSQLGVRFDSYVNYVDDLDLTLITLSVRL